MATKRVVFRSKSDALEGWRLERKDGGWRGRSHARLREACGRGFDISASTGKPILDRKRF